MLLAFDSIIGVNPGAMDLFLLFAAFVFVLATFGWTHPRVNFIAAGLVLLSIALMFTT